MNIDEFILARLDEMEDPFSFHSPVYKLVQAQRKIVEWHKNWPVLIETEAELEREPVINADSYILRMSKQLNWITQQEYIKNFGTEPPTAPLLIIIAATWKDHPDYDPNWEMYVDHL